MKKTLLIITLFMSLALSGSYAQRYALIDMEYILERIPAYRCQQADRKLVHTVASTVDTEIEAVDALYKKYQTVAINGAEKTKH